MHHKLLQLYSGHARKNHQKLAEQFNTAAEELTGIMAIVDVERDATTMVDAPEDQRQAWIAAPLIAAKLDSLLPAIAAAAELAGMSTKDEAVQLALAIDPACAHRRRLWEAWSAKGRTGRWSAILKAGAKIHADQLDRVTAYRHPRPLVHEQEHRDGMVFTSSATPRTSSPDLWRRADPAAVPFPPTSARSWRDPQRPPLPGCAPRSGSGAVTYGAVRRIRTASSGRFVHAQQSKNQGYPPPR